jgi:ABC-type glutathione transport system ATPase component
VGSTEGLDYRIVNALLLAIDTYLKQHQCALLLVSHRQDVVAFLTDTLYWLREGTLARSEPERLAFCSSLEAGRGGLCHSADGDLQPADQGLVQVAAQRQRVLLQTGGMEGSQSKADSSRRSYGLAL